MPLTSRAPLSERIRQCGSFFIFGRLSPRRCPPALEKIPQLLSQPTARDHAATSDFRLARQRPDASQVLYPHVP